MHGNRLGKANEFTVFASKAHFNRIVFEDIKNNTANDSEIFGREIFSSTVEVFMENNVKTPM